MEKINIAELLKDCPKGMELDCTTCNNVVTLVGVDKEGLFPIRVVSKSGFHHLLTCEGCVYADEDAKCVIFPKGKTTWEGFQRPFKDGEILSNGICICLYNGNENDKYYGCYVSVGHIDFPNYFINRPQNSYFTKENSRLATEEEKQKLFDAIKDNGYKWNAENKALEELIEPKFKVGDRIIKKNDVYAPILIARVDKGFYYFNTESYVGILPISDQDSYELVPNKFDISTLKPFESRVLVRDGDDGTWHPSFWGYYEKCSCLSYDTVRGFYNQCIPYEGNEHLLGTKGDCEEYFKTWKE